MTFLVYLGMLLCGLYVVTCEQDAPMAPTITPAIDTGHKVDSLPPCTPPECWPDPRPPGTPNKDSPLHTDGLIAIVEPLEPQTAGVWSWSEGTRTPIACPPHLVRYIECSSAEVNQGKERVVKAHTSSSHLHRECISTELSLR